jgi:hypothetical protein
LIYHVIYFRFYFYINIYGRRTRNKTLKKTERLELLKKQLEDLENEEEETEETVILEKPKEKKTKENNRKAVLGLSETNRQTP